VSTPTVIGWLRPVVLLPAAALASLTVAQVEAILAHELAHIRRHDFFVNLLQTVAETLLFYHPAVWWISTRIRIEREHSCDDIAVDVCGDAGEYAAALTELASWTVMHAPLAMAATRGPLITRIRRLLGVPDHDDKPSRRTLFAVVMLLASVVVVVTLGAIVKAQPLSGGAPSRGFGPPELNAALGFNLFPAPVRFPTDDPSSARAWSVSLTSADVEMPLIGFTARGLIREAYGLDLPIVDAPRWMDRETLDLSIPAPEGTFADGRSDSEQVRAALRDAFEQRLGLSTHREQRTFPAYALVRANKDGSLGPNIKPSTSDCVTGLQPMPERIVEPRLQARGQVTVLLCGLANNMTRIIGRRMTMGELARDFRRGMEPIAPDREIVDRTGLTGAYDFTIQVGFVPLAAIGNAHPALGALLAPLGVRNLADALPDQLGLKLVDATVTHDVLVIDNINRP
jgi:uncharacterized protein (TIGR03435 family)